MLFNEIIDTHGIEGVSSKTNISTINLGYLVEEEFGRLNRVKALGFLLILEREYKEIDVADLRDRIKTYYDEHRPADDKVVMVSRDSVEGGSFSFFKLFVVLALLGGGYYLYTQGKLDGLLKNMEDKQDFFDDKKALESNVSDADADKVVVGKSEKESVRIKTPIAPKVETIALNDDASKDSENIKKIQTLASSKEASASSDENKSVVAIVKEVSEEFLASEESTVVEVMEPKVEEIVLSSIATVTINPTRGMLWFGFTNLDTKKRREFMKKVSTPFNIDDGRWLLVTGHGYLDVVTDNQTLELADNKKHYFYIDSTEVREIDKKEYRELNGRRGW